ncbi:hypothetical protein BDDG_11744 [Blastomyces dermatitidis ATCC 18188]|uniref:ZZ-type domain-containing protein n=1 Tax=Ajellomyces dermatitidis (strain ATCC 18188 / CBS 674.68) TaxID=653446 RepID=A0A0J9EKB4_AJEDA|nr:hypothetical protein BDDG_11744 [Blastomyces dermatitidis ATCC 18188]
MASEGCDNCRVMPIVGHRFRCINCIDFDLVIGSLNNVFILDPRPVLSRWA